MQSIGSIEGFSLLMMGVQFGKLSAMGYRLWAMGYRLWAIGYRGFIVKKVGSGQWAVFFGRFSSPGMAPTAMAIYRENA